MSSIPMNSMAEVPFRRTIGSILLVMAIGCLIVESAMMAMAGSRFGYDPKEQALFMAFGVLAAVGVAISPMVAGVFWKVGYKFWAGVFVLAWFGMAAYSMTSTITVRAVGFAEVKASRALQTVSYQDNRAVISDLERQLKSTEEALNFLPLSRTPEAIQAEIKAQQASKRWAATSQCANPTTPRSRVYCQGIARLEAEKADSGKRVELQGVIDTLTRKLADTRKASTIAPGMMSSADPANVVLASLAEWDQKPSEKSVWASEMLQYILVAFLLLLSSAFVKGGFHFWGLWAVGKVMDAFPGGSGGHVFTTHNIRLEEAEKPLASPYMATKMPEGPTTAEKLQTVAEELGRRLKGLVRPTGPSAPMIEVAA